MTNHQRILALALLFLVTGCVRRATSSGTENHLPSEDPPSVENATHPPIADSPAWIGSRDTGKETTEKAVPILSFRPDALIEVSFGRDQSEVYGYDAAGGRLEPLTSGELQVDARKGILAVAPSPVGDWFAYARGNGHEGAHGVCVRSIRGGEAQCFWQRVGYRLNWRPGTGEVWMIGGDRGESWFVLELAAGKLKKKDVSSLPTGDLGSFSPDGSLLTYSDSSQYWIASAAAPGSSARKWGGGTGPWLNATQVVAAEDRRIGLLDTAGHHVALAQPEFKGREVIGDVLVSPNGRHIGISFGLPGAVFQYSGSAALYDMQTNTWTRIAGTIRGWSGDGRWCVLSSQGEKVLLSPENLQTVPFKQSVPGSFVNASPDGEWLVFRDDYTWTVYQISTGLSHHLRIEGGQPVGLTWVAKE